ncbi:caspase-10 [Phyllostomus hastatus]|uniref:caspase-10 n=1 Tax=Phyllostomus hastatus TaxID=9423 RepID=UPI001E682647|nr:caspase-10 [Phyllostomus hastatus]XP_045703530.1 caspase-10 [Phyllostomus hastatus]XP_045703531.1 caspase-10 [Phyllostomus hastatus]
MSFQGQNCIPSSFANDSENFRRRLLAIDSQLGDKEVEQLKFLCQDFISQKKLEKSSSALDVFDHLMAKELLSEQEPFFLAELLYTMKQHLLLKHLNYRKEQVRSLLPTLKKVSPFRNLLYELSESIDTDILKEMSFIVKESLPKVQLTSLSFLGYLEKQAAIDADNLTLLESLCSSAAPNLVEKIKIYKREKEAEQRQDNKVAAFTGCVPVVEEANGGQKEEILSSSDVQQLLQALPEEAVYRMDHKHRGHCVVINNQNFTSLKERKGTQKDADCLKHVFQWLGFFVHTHVDVTKSQLEELLKMYQNHPGHAEGDCFVFCVLTHGKYGAVYSSDEALIPIKDIMSHFTAHRCPRLASKPKLFFIQACQGEEIQSSVCVEVDAVNAKSTHPPLQDSVPVEADFLLGLATVPGYVSFRHTTEGSWYIQSLCNYLKDYVPRHQDILSILTAVNDDVSRRGGTQKQMPQPVFTLRKKVIFPVPEKKHSYFHTM